MNPVSDVSHFEIELKKLTTEQRRSVLYLVVFYDVGFDDAVKEIRGKAV
jgi:ribosome recycling factor